MQNDEWRKAQLWEQEWHGNCANSYNEETKQFVYANRMGFNEFKKVDNAGRVYFDFGTKSVIDIGGGAYSLLLKSVGNGTKTVVDPCPYPKWVAQRYFEMNIDYIQAPAETIKPTYLYDLAIIYNCLQHTIDPQKIIENVRKTAREIRIFEWIETGINIGHPHQLKEQELNQWLGGYGKVEQIDENGCVGKCYYGIFPNPYFKETYEDFCLCGQSAEVHNTAMGLAKHATFIANNAGISLKDVKI